MNNRAFDHTALRLPATLLLAGQLDQNLAQGLALLLYAATVARTASIPRPIAYLMGLAGLTYVAQGWVVGSQGFTQTMSIAIVLAWVIDLVWMIWLAAVGWRTAGRLSDVKRAG